MNKPSLQESAVLGILATSMSACSPELSDEQKMVTCQVQTVESGTSTAPKQVGEATVTLHANPVEEIIDEDQSSTGEVYTVTANVFTNCDDDLEACLKGANSMQWGFDTDAPHTECSTEVFYPVGHNLSTATYQSYHQDFSVTGTGDQGSATLLTIARQLELKDGSLIDDSMGNDENNHGWPYTDGKLTTKRIDFRYITEELDLTEPYDTSAIWYNLNGVAQQL